MGMGDAFWIGSIGTFVGATGVVETLFLSSFFAILSLLPPVPRQETGLLWRSLVQDVPAFRPLSFAGSHPGPGRPWPYARSSAIGRITQQFLALYRNPAPQEERPISEKGTGPIRNAWSGERRFNVIWLTDKTLLY